ncbi:YhcN/YlaJ family sporulation lipoprotein [Alkalihalophilus lindianensis]|uniref:YhcN/YlaJ family sporulation lipoprotein n=1 Tax=Alkalihalophilus lindianensis TaxID=1630542 RepID=A0ABU3X6M8_9BACI|nr:YhcN/YlaJ family sporulation lipoprotein [Alkalihalophilus lindianensis]MDV2683554.1 YhcN/YlaJ family sporulation lipoprotein [Alkalihalophilus lindianensis]
MKRIMLILLALMCMTGCTIEQKSTLGANADREEGFSGYGVKRMKGWEGPLMDMMVPDAAPKGITDSVTRINNRYDYVSGNRDLGMAHEGTGTAHSGAKILNNRPGILRDKTTHTDHIKRDMKNGQKILTTKQDKSHLKETIESFEEVEQVYILADDQTVVIGVVADQTNLQSLKQMVEGVAHGYYPSHQIIVTADRQFLRRMNRLQD